MGTPRGSVMNQVRADSRKGHGESTQGFPHGPRRAHIGRGPSVLEAAA